LHAADPRLDFPGELLRHPDEGSRGEAPSTSALHPVARLAHEAIRRLASEPALLGANCNRPGNDEIEELCLALISGGDGHEAAEIVAALTLRYPARQQAQLLAEAARMLGDWWLEDRASFVDVTVGTGRIMSMWRPVDNTNTTDGEVPVIFASVPGEQHTLGIRMAADAFRRDGWAIRLRIGLPQDELVAEVQRANRCVVGLSIAGRHSLKPLSGLVETLARACPDASVLVCGHEIGEIEPHLASMGLGDVAREMAEARVKLATLWERARLIER
jgi:methanogenic corrinoid protein MtbC1